MSRTRIEFANASGESLAGLLELPDAGAPQAMALFAHCFTCGKDIAAASRIARGLAARGIGVLRFDFTGLGGSDGDFANTNFSSNIDDLLAAADYLAAEHMAPTLLVGHSLGGAAVLVAAQRLASVKAVATIGAPATAHHIAHLVAGSRDEIAQAGEARVAIAGRPFTIKSQFLDDIDRYNTAAHIGALRRPLLVFHAPLDRIVGIREAAEIYRAARHPKSFISLDGADHLLSDPADAEYVAETLVAWAGRYLGLSRTEVAPKVAEGRVLVTEQDRRFLRGLYTHWHRLQADEPLSMGGQNRGPNPYDLLLMALGACTSMTLRQYANHKQLPIGDLEVELEHDRIHAEDCEACEHREGRLERITRVIRYRGELTEAQRQRLLQMADRCPVHRTLTSAPLIVTRDGSRR